MPAWGCLHEAESWEPISLSVLSSKGQPLRLKYQPLLFFADFLGKRRLRLDQEMSLLSRVDLSAGTNGEERTVLRKLRLAASCCWWKDPPFALTVAGNEQPGESITLL